MLSKLFKLSLKPVVVRVALCLLYLLFSFYIKKRDARVLRLYIFLAH